METIQPNEREAILAALAAPVRRAHRHPLIQQIAVERELSQLASIFRLQRTEPDRPLLMPAAAPEFKHQPRCNHLGYHLTCGEYEMLHQESGGFCDICGRDFGDDQRRWLQIDHDHAVGWRAVRGLICQSCNQLLANIDAGARKPSSAFANYLSDPWYQRVGIEDVACPSTCGNSAHGNTPPAPRPAPLGPCPPSSAERREYLLAQLRALP